MALARLGDITFSVNESEMFTRKNKITNHPVEDNTSISDNVVPQPDSIKISGIIVNDESQDRLQTLKRYAKEATILTYIGIETYESVVIETITTTRDNQIRNGFNYSIGLKIIRLVTSQIVVIDARKVSTTYPNNQLAPIEKAVLSNLGVFGAVIARTKENGLFGKITSGIVPAIQSTRDRIINSINVFQSYAENTFSGGTES